MLPITKRAEKLAPSETLAMAARARELRARGVDGLIRGGRSFIIFRNCGVGVNIAAPLNVFFRDESAV